MILIDDAKYSCLECIRGHRSSQCRHYSKPLLQVRSKGRPNFQINGNPNHRIAVFAEEFVTKEDEEEALSKKNMNTKNKPVIILKASSKHIFDLENGQVVGEYDENEHNQEEDFSVNAPLIKSDSFVNSSGCCSQGITKPRKSCGCKNRRATGSSQKVDSNNTLKRNIDILKKQSSLLSFQQTSLPDEEKLQFLYNNDWINKLNNGKNLEGITNIDPFTADYRFPDCTVPGSCMCDDNCGCEDCVVHNNHINREFKNLSCGEGPKNRGKRNKVKEEFISLNGGGYDSRQNEISNLGTTSNHSTQQSSPLTHWNHLIDANHKNESTLYCDIVKVPLCTIPGSCVCDDSCTCEGCTVHGNALGNQDLRKDSFNVSQDEKLMDSIDRFNIPWEVHQKGYKINPNDKNLQFLHESNNHDRKSFGPDFPNGDIDLESFRNLESVKGILNTDTYSMDKNASEVRRDHPFESYPTDIDAYNSPHCSKNEGLPTPTFFNFSDPEI